MINEINVIGSRCGLFPDALDALATKRISVTPLIDKIYSLNDGPSAMYHAAQPGAKKILLRPKTTPSFMQYSGLWQSVRVALAEFRSAVIFKPAAIFGDVRVSTFT